MRIDLAAVSRLLTRKIVQVSLAQTGVVAQLTQRAANGRMRCVGQFIGSSQDARRRGLLRGLEQSGASSGAYR